MTAPAKAVALSAEQAGREHALAKAAVLDFACVAMLLTLGIAADSLTNLAEGIRGGLMTLVDLVTLTVLRRLHRGTSQASISAPARSNSSSVSASRSACWAAPCGSASMRWRRHSPGTATRRRWASASPP